MGLLALIGLYGASALALALAVKVRGHRARPITALVLSLVPLAFTGEGFLPRRALAPTRLLAYVAPWADPLLVAQVERDGSAANPVLLDPATQMIPWDRAARDGLLFNPASAAGAALLGNGQSAVLFPTEVLARWLPPFRAVTYRQAGRLLIAVWGVFYLVRLLGNGEMTGIIAAATMCGSGFLQLWRLHAHSNVAAVVPWILAAAVALLRHPGRREAVLLGAAGAVGVFGGHPETLLHALVFCLVAAPLLASLGGESFAAAGPHGARPQGPFVPQHLAHAGAAARWGACSALLAALFAAPILLPLTENLRQSLEWREFRGERRAQFDVTLADSLQRLRPTGALLALGDPRRDSWVGVENLAELGAGSLGAPALFLALLALERERRRSGPLLLLGLLGVLVSAHVPLVSAPFAWVPLLRDTLLKRLGLWWVMAVSLLAGVGAAGAGPSRPRYRAAVAVAAFLVVAGMVALMQGGAPASERSRILWLEQAPLVLVFIVVLLGAVAARAPEKRREGGPERSRALACSLVLVALVVPRAVLFGRWVPVTPPAGFYPLTTSVQVVLDRLAEIPPHGYRVAGTGGALAPSAAAFYGLEEIRANDPLAFAPYAKFLATLGEVHRTGWVDIQRPTGPVLDYLGVRFVFDHARAVRSEPNTALHRGPEGVVWERPGAMPRAFFPRTLQLEQDPTAALDAALQVDDFAARTVVTGADMASGNNPGARVLDLEVGRGELRAEVEASAMTVLATSQPAIPGWRLFVDDHPRPERMCRINGAFLGAVVPEGRHRLHFRYRPRSWSIGLALAAVGVLVAGVLLAARPQWRAPTSAQSPAGL